MPKNIFILFGALAILAACSQNPPLASVLSRSKDDIWVQYKSSAVPQSQRQAYNLAQAHCQRRDLRTYAAEQIHSLNDLSYRRYICTKARNDP